MKKSIFIFRLLLLASFFNICSSHIEASEIIWLGRVTVPSLLIRSQPNANSQILGRVTKGHLVEVLSETVDHDTINGISAPWYKVRTAKDLTGYMFGGYIERANKYIPDRISSMENRLIGECPLNEKNCNDFLLKKFPQNFKKNQNKLILKTAKKSVIFEDEEKTYLNYTIYQYYPEIKIYVIEVWQYMEVNWFYIVNESSGNFTQIAGNPIFSPDRTRFICVKDYGVSGYGDDRIQVYRIAKNQFIKEFEVIPNWGPSRPLWLNNNEISIVRDDIELPSIQSRYSFVELVFLKEKWILNE